MVFFFVAGIDFSWGWAHLIWSLCWPGDKEAVCTTETAVEGTDWPLFVKVSFAFLRKGCLCQLDIYLWKKSHLKTKEAKGIFGLSGILCWGRWRRGMAEWKDQRLSQWGLWRQSGGCSSKMWSCDLRESAPCKQPLPISKKGIAKETWSVWDWRCRPSGKGERDRECWTIPHKKGNLLARSQNWSIKPFPFAFRGTIRLTKSLRGSSLWRWASHSLVVHWSRW